jgi:hypothetical protein
MLLVQIVLFLQTIPARAYLMVTPLELSMSTLCLFLGFSTSASRATLLLAPLLSDLYTAAMAVDVCVLCWRNGILAGICSLSQGGKKLGHMQKARVSAEVALVGVSPDAEQARERLREQERLWRIFDVRCRRSKGARNQLATLLMTAAMANMITRAIYGTTISPANNTIPSHGHCRQHA